MTDEKQRIINLIKQACQSGARQSSACEFWVSPQRPFSVGQQGLFGG